MPGAARLKVILVHCESDQLCMVQVGNLAIDLTARAHKSDHDCRPFFKYRVDHAMRLACFDTPKIRVLI